jgi:hypothetical protein
LVKPAAIGPAQNWEKGRELDPKLMETGASATDRRKDRHWHGFIVEGWVSKCGMSAHGDEAGGERLRAETGSSGGGAPHLRALIRRA